MFDAQGGDRNGNRASDTDPGRRQHWTVRWPAASIRVANERVPVIEIAHVRDELAAYPVERGPRRIFEVRTPDARLRLSFEKRRRRWLLEGLEAA